MQMKSPFSAVCFSSLIKEHMHRSQPLWSLREETGQRNWSRIGFVSLPLFSFSPHVAKLLYLLFLLTFAGMATSRAPMLRASVVFWRALKQELRAQGCSRSLLVNLRSPCCSSSAHQVFLCLRLPGSREGLREHFLDFLVLGPFGL